MGTVCYWAVGAVGAITMYAWYPNPTHGDGRRITLSSTQGQVPWWARKAPARLLGTYNRIPSRALVRGQARGVGGHPRPLPNSILGEKVSHRVETSRLNDCL